jgi:hypothetical protein
VKPFPTPALTWQPGETRLHVYACPDLNVDRELADLIGVAREVMAQFPPQIMVPVDDAWLHATVSMVSMPAASLDAPTRVRLAETLVAAVVGVPAFQLTAGPALCGTGGVVLDLSGDQPGQPWDQLSTLVRRAILEVCGPQALRYNAGAPHISLSYAASHADSGPVQGRLRQAVRARAPFSVNEIRLLDVHQDAEAHLYTWQSLARIPLAGSARDPREAISADTVPDRT